MKTLIPPAKVPPLRAPLPASRGRPKVRGQPAPWDAIRFLERGSLPPRLHFQDRHVLRGEDLLQHQLDELEEWAIKNRRNARADGVAFWILKLPAIVASASAGILARFDLTMVSLVLGSLASFCILLDGLYSFGALRNTHVRAFHDIRIVENRMASQWHSRTQQQTLMKQRVASSEMPSQTSSAFQPIFEMQKRHQSQRNEA